MFVPPSIPRSMLLAVHSQWMQNRRLSPQALERHHLAHGVLWGTRSWGLLTTPSFVIALAGLMNNRKHMQATGAAPGITLRDLEAAETFVGTQVQATVALFVLSQCALWTMGSSRLKPPSRAVSLLDYFFVSHPKDHSVWVFGATLGAKMASAVMLLSALATKPQDADCPIAKNIANWFAAIALGGVAFCSLISLQRSRRAAAVAPLPSR